MHPLTRLIVAGAAATLPALTLAHVGADAAGHHDGLAAGFMHPFTGVDHLVAMLAVGVWAALNHAPFGLSHSPFGLNPSPPFGLSLSKPQMGQALRQAQGERLRGVHSTWWAVGFIPATFAVLLLVGALLSQFGHVTPAMALTLEPMIATSLLVLGLLVATRRALPTPAGMALVGGFALFHGAAHGAELAGPAALAGMVLATGLLHGAGLLIGLQLRGRSVWLTRIAGLASAAFGATLWLA